ncbi:MAG: hotdog fold thioesterase [Parachlamydia sp.]|nr:hotdog fold thioesterase [Parachlamydia sp.]
MPIWKRTFTLEEASATRSDTMMEHLGIELVEIGEDFLRARMPVDHRTKQVFGIMHGGASCALAETVGSIAAYYCIDTAQYYSVGVEINTSHIKTVRSGYVYGTARPFHIGRSTQVWEILIHDEAGQLISVNRLRMAVLDK